MMRIDRRTMLKGGGALGAVAGVPASAAAMAKGKPLVVFDSRIPESLAFATRRIGARQIDLARDETQRWARLRGMLPGTGAIEGLTGWSDWVALRGELEARGWRFERDDPVAAPLSGKAHLFRWTLKARG